MRPTNKGGVVMSATIFRFPVRESIRVVREQGGEGWLVITHRGHGWSYGDHAAAVRDAYEVARGFGTEVRASAEFFNAP